MNQKPESKRKSKTILILSIITSLFMGVMGYELATHRTAQPEKEVYTQKFTILSKEQPVASHDRKQYASMHAQNQHLANKVTALKEHALELTRRLNLVQLSVFSAHKSHDQSIIQDLQVKLENQEHANVQLQTEFAQLQQNFDTQDHQAMMMESTIDHLTEMVEIQRISKEKALDGLRTNLEIAAASEKARLVDVIQELETHQSKLKTDLEKQSAEIAALEENLSQYKSYSQENESALLFALEQHEQKQKELLAQTENLASLLNLEEIAVQSLQSEIQFFEESERKQTLAFEKELQLNTMQLIHESMLQEDFAHLLELDVVQKQADLDLALANLSYAQSQMENQKSDIALLREQRAEREQELLQERESLIADLTQKQEDLSLALSKFNSSEIALYDQTQEIENLKESIAQKEADLEQIRSMAAEQMQQNDQLIAEMARKQDELTAALSKYDRADLSLIEQQQELIGLTEKIALGELQLSEARAIATEQIQINQNLLSGLMETEQKLALQKTEAFEQQEQLTSLKEQLAKREEEFLQATNNLKTDLAQKEELLAFSVAKSDSNDASLQAHKLEIVRLQQEIAQSELKLVESSDKYAAEIKAHELLIADMAAKQEEISQNVAQFAQEEISTLKEQMAVREQELLQANAALRADNIQKEENLALALTKFGSLEINLNTQTLEIAALKEQIAQRELELVQLSDKAAAEAKDYQQLIADMTTKQEEISTNFALFAQEEISVLKEQMALREQDLIQTIATLKSDIAQKEENLSIALAKSDGSEASLASQNKEIAFLKDQITQREEEIKANLQLVSDMATKQEEVFSHHAQLAQDEIAALKEQMAQREQELLQTNAALQAGILAKEQELSLALAKFDGSVVSLSAHMQEIAALKDQISQNEVEFVRLNDKGLSEARDYQQLLADIELKHEEITSNSVQFALEEITSLKEQMEQREQELQEVNVALKADIAQKEEILASALTKFNSTEASLNTQAEEIATLKEQIAQREEEIKTHQQFIANMALKEVELADQISQYHALETRNAILYKDLLSQKDEMIRREQELLQVNATLAADLAQKEENLSLTLSKAEENEILLKNKAVELASLQDQFIEAKDAAATIALSKTELSTELKNLQHELITAFGKIEAMETQIAALNSQLTESQQTVTASDTQRSLLMEEMISYKNALVNALSNYENEHERAASLEQQLNSLTPADQEKEEESKEELRSLINQEGFEDQAALDAPGAI